MSFENFALESYVCLRLFACLVMSWSVKLWAVAVAVLMTIAPRTQEQDQQTQLEIIDQGTSSSGSTSKQCWATWRSKQARTSHHHTHSHKYTEILESQNPWSLKRCYECNDHTRILINNDVTYLQTGAVGHVVRCACLTSQSVMKSVHVTCVFW